ncbi:MAG: hypothetical protein CUN55_03040 [Phototrophicales bacterium]|nr:MAG: hypothetical protein CUN55_03040 [Phototrophicales bacterium]
MTSYDLQGDLKIFLAMVDHLVPYVYEKELFGQISNRYPKLTLGGVLMRRHRISALRDELAPEQSLAFEEAVQKLETLRYEWLSHYQDKLLQEFHSRINSLVYFVEDCEVSWNSCDANWPNEAEKRTLVAHVVEEAQSLNIFDTEHRAVLTKLDQKLRRFFRESAFLWDERLKAAYPFPQYWWLYGRPGRKEEPQN